MAKKNGGCGEDKSSKQNNNNGGDINIVLKIHLHCNGCITKLRKCIKDFPGVRTVEFEGADKANIMGGKSVDVQKLSERIERKTNKKVEIVSPLPKKEKDNKNNQSEQDKPKEPPVTTVVLKLVLHCHGCTERIQKTISNFKGVYEVSLDKEKNEVKVMGKMDSKKLVEELREKFKRSVEIIPDKKDKNNDKKEKNEKGGENNKGGGAGKGCTCCGIHHQCTTVIHHNAATPGGCYHHHIVADPVPFYPTTAPQIFSDENPNACSLM